MKLLEIVSSLPLYAVVIPIIGALLLILISEKKDNIRNPVALLTSLATALVVIFILQEVFKGNILSYKLVKIMPGLEFAFRIDPLVGFSGSGFYTGFLRSFIPLVTCLLGITGKVFHIFPAFLSVTMGIAFSRQTCLPSIFFMNCLPGNLSPCYP